MNLFIDLVRQLSRVCGVFASILIASAIVVVCQMVVLRYFLQASTVWQTDYVTYALVAATLIGSPYVLLIKGHVNVDLLPHYLNLSSRRVLAFIASVCGLAFTLLLAWKGYELFAEALNGGWVTDTIWELPLWIPYLSLPLGVGLLSLQYLADILALLSGRDMPFAMNSHSSFEGE
ncbi:C4-dicarboxylate ABC transporter substrate-binding protein [Kiloniella spongiae]|uniref:TRAP transporter small permease protein n=1 Tax=Kiloniella spongiae TaxID=1489064 RepID=A0A0H2M9H6_9PROT|nr:TRAP transporter small permease [Kiloniella spongiae]KLN59174.1 C4-dicarboxylate ABC transporter substrate-binding protein [Kiloniella spongiae]